MGNKYILRCGDGVSVDGNKHGISRFVYNSVHGRDRLPDGARPVCDVSWIATDGARPVNPLNVGQIVNNAPSEEAVNVSYHELDLDLETFDPNLRVFLPNVHYKSANQRYLRLVPLVAVRDIEAGEELYSSYFSIITA